MRINIFLRYLRHPLWAVVLSVTTGNAVSAEYEYRDLLGNTLPPQKCAVQTDAERRAREPYTIDKYVKVFCETQGYGWHVAAVKEQGRLVCKTCDGQSGKQQCHLEDVRVTCKHIKPGSVGLFPGEG